MDLGGQLNTMPSSGRHWKKDGEPIGNLDLMIAAQAVAAEAVLVTHDRVLRRVNGLRCDDWSKP